MNDKNTASIDGAATATLSKISNRTRVWFFIMLVVAYFCSLYNTDAITPIASLLQSQLGFSNEQLGSLNAIANLPNIFFVILAGILCDKFGSVKVLVGIMVLACLGSLVMAMSSSYSGMLTGRLLVGIGTESLVVAEAAAIARWFGGRWFAFLLALHVAIARLGSFSADWSPTLFPKLYTNWNHPMWLTFGISIIAVIASIICLKIAHSSEFKRVSQAHIDKRLTHQFHWSQLKSFNRSFWYIILLGVMFYSPIIAFRSTFAIAYFQNEHGLSLADAGQLNSLVFLAAFIATPIFGWICDKYGHSSELLILGMVVTLAGFLMLATGSSYLMLVTICFGIGYSVIPAVLWPSQGYVVAPALLGTGYGLMDGTQGVGQGLANLIGGWFNDVGHAGVGGPAGAYNGMLYFFVALCALGLLAAILLHFSGLNRSRKMKEKAVVV